MPKYSYGCEACSREWTQWNSLGEDPVDCPHCFSKNIKKIPSSFVVIAETAEKRKTAKENVIDHIEENKEILKKMREQSSDERGTNNV